MDKPVWMDDWEAQGANLRTGNSRNGAHFMFEEECRLAAAAPALVRALLGCEWGGSACGCDGGADPCCPSCQAVRGYPHSSWCTLDAALTAAGFPDQASRNEARRIMREEVKS